MGVTAACRVNCASTRNVGQCQKQTNLSKAAPSSIATLIASLHAYREGLTGDTGGMPYARRGLADAGLLPRLCRVHHDARAGPHLDAGDKTQKVVKLFRLR